MIVSIYQDPSLKTLALIKKRQAYQPNQICSETSSNARQSSCDATYVYLISYLVGLESYLGRATWGKGFGSGQWTTLAGE